MYEYFTTGGGWYLFNFFSAVAAICDTAEFEAAMITAMLIASAWVMFTVAFQSSKWNIASNWLAVSVVVVAGLMSPSATVKVTDRLNTVDSSGYIIDDVPYGLALFASLTSSVGDRMTRLFEVNFADVDAPELQKNGFLFGAKMLAEATRIEIKNEYFDASLSSFIRNCVFYDILQGRKSWDAIRKADNPWTEITSDPSVARMFEIRQSNGSGGWTGSIKTCQDGVADLNAFWPAETDDGIRRLNLVTSTNRGNQNFNAVQAILATELSSFHQYLIGVSRTSAEILQRQMTINAVFRAPADWLAETGNDAGLKDYIDARLQLQTRESYKSIGRQAERWTANLKAVFQCMYIGIFPIAVLLMLSPMGATILKNYIFGLVWVESWGTLYALLNYIMNSQARQGMKAAVEAASSGSQDITLFAQAGIQAVEADIAVLAGYLSMSIPFIAIALVSGASRFAHLATSTLAVSQEAVGDTTREAVTGNIGIGNTQYDTSSYNNTSANSHNTSAHWDSGRSSAYADSGALLTEAPGGRTVADSSSAISSFNITPNITSGLSSSFTKSANDSTTAAEGFATSKGQSISALTSDVNAFADTISANETSAFNYNTGESGSVSQDFRILQDAAKTFSQTHGVSEQEGLRAIIGAHAKAGIEFAGSGAGGSIAGEINLQTSDNVSHEDALKVSESEQVSEALQRLTSASTSESANFSQGTGQSFSDSVESRFQEIESLDQKQDASLQQAQRYEEAATLVSSQNAGINQNLSQSFYEWFAQQEVGGHALGSHGAERILNSTNSEDQQFAQAKASEFVDQVAEGYVKVPDIPDLGSVYNTAAQNITDSSDVSGTAAANVKEIPTGGDIAQDHDNNAVITKTTAQGNLGLVKKDIEAGQGSVNTQNETVSANVAEKGEESKGERLVKQGLGEIGDTAGVVTGIVSSLAGEHNPETSPDYPSEDGSDTGVWNHNSEENRTPAPKDKGLGQKQPDTSNFWKYGDDDPSA